MPTAKSKTSQKKIPQEGHSDTSGLTLIIAEKPSVAADLAKVLGGKFTKEKSHYENPSFIISWALGHLVTIADPGEIDERYKSWRMDTLPIIPEKFALKPIPETKSHLTALGKLIRRKDVVTIINACDAGREGELIFHYILDYEGGKDLAHKRIMRLWMQSMTPAAIREAFERLRTHEDMQRLRDAALSRSEADWLVGINSSRGLTAYNSRRGGFHLTPAGRVQTPTLTLIVNREIERQEFQPKNFWTVSGSFVAGQALWNAHWFDPSFKKEDGLNEQDNAYRIWDEAQARAIADKCRGKPARVEESSKQQSQNCPPLYDLTSLQREANSRFGFSARTTLQIAQALYEKHKLTTYPRTDSKFLPEDYPATVRQILSAIRSGPLAGHARQVLEKDWVRPGHRVFNNAKVSDHHAIIPTGNPQTSHLSEAEHKIYSLIAQRFIAVFFPPAIYQNTVRIATVENEQFRAEGKILTDPGWRVVYGKDADEEESGLPWIPAGTDAQAIEMSTSCDQTRPPARYNESSLLSVMESAGKLIEDDDLRDAMKDRGLGTPATRAAIIEGLLHDKYILRDGKDLVPTAKAFELVRLANAMKIEDLTSPELTGEWEYKLGLIEKGLFTRSQFMREIETLTRRIVDHIRNFQEDHTRAEASFGPVNGKRVTETVSAYETEDGIVIRKVLGGRRMHPEEVKILLEQRRIGPLQGFRSKRGKEFSASLILNDRNQVVFEFAETAGSSESTDLSRLIPLGNSPLDESPVYDIGSAYVSASALEGKKSGLRIGKIILGRAISPEDMQAMLRGESTALIKGFVSARTRRSFDAKLRLTKSGKIEFEFPPRETARPARKNRPAQNKTSGDISSP